MAKGARFVTVYRELLVVQHCLAKQLDLLDLIVWRRNKSGGCLHLDGVDLGLDLRNVLKNFGRKI
ncbi:MAG TPA: hypothetical protein VGJ20_20175 [Xanthobacteraceae bacterium]|jgi:hypothetical protein